MALVVLAMSGGVDSSVAAKLLVNAGHDVVGVFMRHGEPALECKVNEPQGSANGPYPSNSFSGRSRTKLMGDRVELPIVQPQPMGHKQGCCTASDAEDARRVAGMLGIPFYALNLRAEFNRVIEYFVEEYARGRTPNPCVMCNHWIKFGHLFEYADSIGADIVATGHYARIRKEGDHEVTLHRGLDDDKDQAYVLFGIRRDLLRRVDFPVGRFHKSEIRRMARDWGLKVASKKDSQEICFVESGHHPEFVAARTGIDSSGEIVTTQGKVVGRHPGIEHFTIGQRRGIGVALGEPAFVVRIDADSRRVVIGSRNDLARLSLRARQANWLVSPPQTPFQGLVQIRYNSPPQKAIVQPIGDDEFEVRFDEPCLGVAPGQAAVCFRDDQLLGGGWIA